MSARDIVYGVAEAARVCDVSVDTIRRRLREHRIPGAHRSGSRPEDLSAEWRIPRKGLLAAGLLRDDATASTVQPSLGPATGDLTIARAEAEQHRQRADALAALVDRQAHQLELAQQALLRQQQICSDLLDRYLDARAAA
jgi:hypothetical protein